MYILRLLRNNTMPNMRAGNILFTDPIFVSRDQDEGTEVCACTFFLEHAMEFSNADDGIEWIQKQYSRGLKIAGMFGVVQK